MEDSEKMLDVAEPTMEETETTETTPDQNVETNKEELEFTDNSESNEHENDESSKEVEESKTQSKEENFKFAEVRRKAEADAELKFQSKVEEAYQKGKMEFFVGKINPYTETVIKDATDIQVYENMYALEQSGKDPIADYASYIADKQREELKAKAEQEKLQKEAENDIAEFTEKYPDVNLHELLEDETFKDYIEGKRKPLTTLYENYKKMENNFRNKGVEVAKQTIANFQATPGSLGSGSDVQIDYQSMSSVEFEKMIQRAKDGELR